jgi:acetyl-CoA synthetase
MKPVKPAIAAAAQVGSLAAYRELFVAAQADPQGYWLDLARRRLDWVQPPTQALAGGFEAVDFSWFADGRLNASVQCLDRHLPTRAQKTAIIWAKDEPGDYEHITYADLAERVGRMANVLRAQGVQRGDRVCLYLPMVPELAVAMLACARIGAVHSIVFAGFSAAALSDRILDAECALVITADEGLRGGKTIPLKVTTDAAVALCPCVQTVLVVRRTGAPTAMTEGRDRWLQPLLDAADPECAPETMGAEDPLFILYTSGSTGKPKGVLHTTAGYMLYASLTHEAVFDLRPDDVYFCAADIGWVTGHSYIIYGPLANGATTVMFESTPLYPNAERYWQVVEDLGVNSFYTAPTAIRAIAREGDAPVLARDRSSLRVLGTVGEPISPEVWDWYHDVVGEGRCAVVDTWWQTETGGILISPLPGATPTKAGSATLPLPGIEPVLVDDDGEELAGNSVSGNLCMARSWPGQARTLYGDHQRFVSTYFSRFPGRYFTGDGCRRDADGYYWITGRVDDVINVSGHRLGTAEVESALVAHPAVAEAAVVGFPHSIKGTGIYAYVQCVAGAQDVTEALRRQVRTAIGPIATPDCIQVVPGLPKTRSGKIMRRILRSVAAGEYEELGDVSTLADPSVVTAIVDGHREQR